MTAYPSRADRLAWMDARLHRCDCGQWLYGSQPCGTCRLALIRNPWPREDDAA